MGRPPTPLPERFWPKVEKSEGCWLWTGAKSANGYGLFRLDSEGDFRNAPAHRVAFALVHGPIAPGILVCHRCDVPLCVRPDHLFAGSVGDNNRDTVAKGRHVYVRMARRVLRGEENAFAKLSAAQVEEIRAALGRGERQRAIAARYGVGQSAISNIKTGATWSVGR